jgi:Ras-related protein Rab-1A
MIGNSGTGKTSLLLRLCNDIFSDIYISTIGIDFKVKTLNIDNKNVKLQIWDTAGQERFKSVISTYYRGIHGIIIVFDLNDIKSFENIDNWMFERDKYCNSNICTLIIGTKSDIKKKDLITDDMISNLCINYGASYIETSSKNDFNVKEAFELICKKLIEKINLFKLNIIILN